MGAEALATRKEAIDYAASSAFEHYDSDNDGSLSQFEFFLLLWDLKSNAAEPFTKEQAQHCWTAVNPAGSASLCVEDFRSGLETLWEYDFFKGGWPAGLDASQLPDIAEYDVTDMEGVEDSVDLAAELRALRIQIARSKPESEPAGMTLVPLQARPGTEMRTIRVYRENESYKTLMITPMTRCGELLRMVIEKLDLSPGESAKMTLHESVNGIMRTLDQTELVSDVEDRNGKVYISDVNLAKMSRRSVVGGAVNLFRKRSSMIK